MAHYYLRHLLLTKHSAHIRSAFIWSSQRFSKNDNTTTIYHFRWCFSNLIIQAKLHHTMSFEKKITSISIHKCNKHSSSNIKSHGPAFDLHVNQPALATYKHITVLLLSPLWTTSSRY